MKRGRFIAGAVCPVCGAVDRVVVEGDGVDRLRRCVECHFTDTLATTQPDEIVRLVMNTDVVRSDE